MEQQSSTSTVTVEYYDPHDVYKLLAPGLVPRLPLHNLHWQSHSGPLRSIDTLHVELVQGQDLASSTVGLLGNSSDNGFGFGGGGGGGGHQHGHQHVGGSSEGPASSVSSLSLPAGGGQRRHQIPGIRSTPYLKLLLVRCDDNDSYKASVRSEIKDWIRTHASPPSKKASSQENHDAFEWLIVHVVIPNTVASTQPRTHHKSDSTSQDKAAGTTSRWRTGSTPLMEKLRTDFNGSAKGAQDRVTQIRIGINDVPYNLLPRVVPAVPTGYTENEQDAENAWSELIGKLKSSILTSFDMRVTHYEEDIREKDAQRSLPGWNFCTFFMLKEGLARGFENVGLVEDALVGYDELSAGLDAVIHEQLETGSPEAHGGAMLNYTKELKLIAEMGGAEMTFDEVCDGDSTAHAHSREASRESQFDEIPISSMKKAYRDMIMENKVSVFDFRCYIFSRQIALLLRLGNAVSSREELLAKLRRQQQSILTGEAPMAPPPPSQKDEPENLAVFAEICERTLQFIPNVSQVLRRDIVAALLDGSTPTGKRPKKLIPEMEDTVENMVASFAFSVAQQILAQTSTKALPIPPSTLSFADGQGSRMSIPEPKTMMHPQRNSSLYVRANTSRQPPSPNVFPGPGRQQPPPAQGTQSHFVKPGLEDLAARRAELYMLSRTVLASLGKKWGWSNGWDQAPVIGEADLGDMEDVSLDDDGAETYRDKNEDNDHKRGSSNDDVEQGEEERPAEEDEPQEAGGKLPSVRGIDCRILRTATGSEEDFHRLYEILTDKAMRHFSVAGHDHAVHSSIADLAVLKFHVKEFQTAASYFNLTAPFFGDGGWNVLELAMLAMYAQCLDEMNSRVDYVSVALRLLTKSCAAERERLREKLGHPRINQRPDFSDALQLRGVVGKLCELSKALASEVQAPLANFFTNIGLVGPPEYHDREDGCSLSLEIRSLLPEQITLDSIRLRIVVADGPGVGVGVGVGIGIGAGAGAGAGASRERVFEKIGEGAITLAPGRNTVKLECNSIVAGRYKIEHLSMSTTNFLLHFGRDSSTSPPRSSDIFKHDDVVLFQRTSAFDMTLTTSKHTSLDKSNNLELKICTGWNAIRSCEVRVKPATGGLRFSTNQATISRPAALELARPPESGTFYFGAIEPETQVTLQFPYSMEQDVTEVCAKVEATYVTESGKTFSAAKTATVPVSLALGVNVQDVFKHRALFSRFNVSTASASPLRLYSSELLGSELFEASFGVPATSATTVFAKQPASLLYRVTRKPGTRPSDRPSARNMYLKLRYSVLETEVEEHMRRSLSRALEGTPLAEYSKLVAACVLGESRNRVQPQDLERAALTGEISTGHLRGVRWEKHLDGLGQIMGHQEQHHPHVDEQHNHDHHQHSHHRHKHGRGGDACTELSAFLRNWLRRNPAIAVPEIASHSNSNSRKSGNSSSSSSSSSDEADSNANDADEPCSILIPVEIPSVSMVHTADIRITTPKHSMLDADDSTGSSGPVVWTNQMLTAALHLQWTRRWRTEAHPAADQEYSYEVSAPADTWLLGGRRRGHFIIPASTSSFSSSSSSPSSSPATPDEGTHPEIPLVLIPLREGWLPYPTVEIREVLPHAGHHGPADAADAAARAMGCEVDLRNLGETVRAVSNRSGVTVSLDASGPGGGPLTFESEGMTGLSGRIVA